MCVGEIKRAMKSIKTILLNKNTLWFLKPFSLMRSRSLFNFSSFSSWTTKTFSRVAPTTFRNDVLSRQQSARSSMTRPSAWTTSSYKTSGFTMFKSNNFGRAWLPEKILDRLMGMLIVRFYPSKDLSGHRGCHLYTKFKIRMFFINCGFTWTRLNLTWFEYTKTLLSSH